MSDPGATMQKLGGFWIRLAATLIDSVLLLVIILPINVRVYGWEYFLAQSLVAGPVDLLVSWIFPAVAVILFWKFRAATPGKMLLGLRVVDATTGGQPSTGRLVLRYVGYFVSLIPLALGYLWIAWDPRKQSFHDKIARTVVVRGPGTT